MAPKTPKRPRSRCPAAPEEDARPKQATPGHAMCLRSHTRKDISEQTPKRPRSRCPAAPEETPKRPRSRCPAAPEERQKRPRSEPEQTKHPLKRDELQEAFTLFCGSDNTIPPSKLGVVIRTIGGLPTEAQLQAIAREFESKGVRTLTCAQVEAIINKYDFAPESSDALRDAFSILSKDSNGLINASELRHIMCNVGEKLEDEEVDEMFREAGLSADGQINLEEFVRMLERGP